MFNKATFDAFVINCFFFCVAMHGLGAEVKYVILTKIFYQTRICSFFLHMVRKRVIQQLNAWTFLMSKNYARIPINVRTTACWSWITFFLRTHCINFPHMTSFLERSIQFVRFPRYDCRFKSMKITNDASVPNDQFISLNITDYNIANRLYSIT